MAQKSPMKGKMMDPEIINLSKGVREVSITLAEQIWHAAADGANVTAAKINSVEHVMAENNMEPAASAFLARKLAATKKKCPGHLAPLKHVGTAGKHTIMAGKYEKELLNIVVKAVQGGKAVKKATAEEINAAAMDDGKATETEFRTIEYIMAFYPFEQDAHDYLEKQLVNHPTIESRTFVGETWIVSAKRTAEEAGLTCWHCVYRICDKGRDCPKHESGFESGTSQRAKSMAAARVAADSVKRLRRTLNRV